MKSRFTRSLVGSALALVASASLAQVPLVEGEVRKVDKDNQKVTLKHGEIKNLDMPPMTMVFNVQNPSVLEKLNPGDKVQFRAVNEGGKFVVTEIQPAK